MIPAVFGAAPGPATTDEELMSRVRRGETRAFRTLFDRHVGRLVRYAGALCGNREEARDIVQEVFLKVFTRQATYQPGRPFRGWVMGILRHAVIDRWRRTGLRTIPLEPNPGNDRGIPNPADPRQGWAPDFRIETLPLLARLPALQREILILRVVEELSYAEIAAITQLREENLRKIVSRTLDRIRREEEETHGMP